MDPRADRSLETILELLSEQHELAQSWPYTVEQITRDKEISERLRQICDQLYPSTPAPAER